MSRKISKRYAQRGVSAGKEDVHNAIKNVDKGLFPKAFCKIVPDYLTGDADHCLIMHADGAGTKSSLAYMYWKETGDLSVWKGIAQDALIMNIDDLLCVGAVDNIMLSSTIGRNKNKIPGEVISAIINGTEELISELKGFGVEIHSTGGETADVGDLVRTIIVDSTVTARMKKSDVIDNANIKPGNVIVGLSSSGQASYEKEYNGGMGSNGLTSARHDVFSKVLAEKYPESFDNDIPEDLIYSGTKSLTDKVENSPLDAGKLVLSPTRTYAPIIKKILSKFNNKEINGMVHCSGGAQTKILHFIDKGEDKIALGILLREMPLNKVLDFIECRVKKSSLRVHKRAIVDIFDFIRRHKTDNKTLEYRYREIKAESVDYDKSARFKGLNDLSLML